jgi:cell division protease FtsH
MTSNRIRRILRGIFKALIVITLIIGSLVIVKRAKPAYISTSRAFLNLHQDSAKQNRAIQAIYLYPRFNGTMMLRAVGKNGELFRSNIFAMTALHGSPSLTGDIYSYGYPVTIKRMPFNVVVFIASIFFRFIPLGLYVYFSGLRFRKIFNPQFEVSINKNFNLNNVVGQEHVKKIMLRELKYNLFNKKKGINPKQSGILFYGPPGTGKTMFVRAFSGTILKLGNKCKLFAMSGGGISELYVGSGPAKIRSLFKAAREAASDGYIAVIFIDEIEAIGSRATNQHSHANNNIAELLAQLDGITQNTNIIPIFATNYKDRIDSAVLRRGRVDLEIRFGLPTFSERYKLAERFLPKKSSIITKDLEQFSRLTVESTPAFIKSVFTNMEKKLLGKKPKKNDLFDSLREMWMGPKLPEHPKDINKDDKRRTAFHEAGHAFVLAVFSFKTKFFSNFYEQLKKNKEKKSLTKITKSIGENIADIFIATIAPRGNSLGMVMWIPKHFGVDRLAAVNMIHTICSLGGNAGEKCLNGAEVATGCSADFQSARRRIRRHFTYMLGENDGESGAMSDDPRQLGEYDKKIISKKTGQSMKLLYDFTIELLEDNWAIITKIAEELLKKEEIPGSRIYEILDKNKPTINLESFQKITNFFLRMHVSLDC